MAVGFFQRLSGDPVGSRRSLRSADGLGADSPDQASGRQNDRCVAKAQHMLHEGLGLARTLGVVCSLQQTPREILATPPHTLFLVEVSGMQKE